MKIMSNFKSDANSRLNAGAWANPKMSQARDQCRSNVNGPSKSNASWKVMRMRGS